MKEGEQTYFCLSFDAYVRQNNNKQWVGFAEIGNIGYETSPYLTKAGAMSELKGYLEGLMVQMQAFMEYLDGEFKNENTV